MQTRHLISFLSAILFFYSVEAQKAPPANWFNLDKNKNKVRGVSTEKAYDKVLKGKSPAKKVIVAVIDGGTDPEHEDLAQLIWKNPGEVAGNGVDDDRNGYADDVHGWSFIGGKNGDVDEDNLEMARLYKKWKPLYDKADTTRLNARQKDEYRQFEQVRLLYENEMEEYGKMNEYMGNILKDIDRVQKKIGKDEPTLEELEAYKPAGNREMIAVKTMQKVLKAHTSVAALKQSVQEAHEFYNRRVNVHLNTKLDTRAIVGDNYEDVNERHYGNNHVHGPKGDHGTHVAGIIGAVRDNGKGINGVSNTVQILVVRVVPDGDERDKDVANGIRYAVDQGASVINMSFGKAFSPDKEAVDEAVRYAMSKDVLIVHAAGNDAQDNDVNGNFPKATYKSGGGSAEGWIEVGASSWKKKKETVAEFSNYGKKSVDVLAPGVDIYSTLPRSTYGTFSGTSMAAPVVSGVAALIRAYYPNLTAVQVKEILMKSAVKVKGKVHVPGDPKKKVKAAELCRTGAIVNAYEALRMASSYNR